ncbi:hypothetical protein FHX48_002323 [Microbacterium halimionae]|uniref:Uncharacterized protein n=1 Tax=Microbacterium halimionae TaxID=1526413 RepID=A0A7W3JQN6_9MICO|nr:hypothetical protein [Microbacterium halimionae]MBA8817225.1 hypothetical protein [Microbacterium halimionae]NII94675.1 hypothetical protein [Microbacterium halimionae]
MRFAASASWFVSDGENLRAEPSSQWAMVTGLALGLSLVLLVLLRARHWRRKMAQALDRSGAPVTFVAVPARGGFGPPTRTLSGAPFPFEGGRGAVGIAIAESGVSFWEYSSRTPVKRFSLEVETEVQVDSRLGEVWLSWTHERQRVRLGLIPITVDTIVRRRAKGQCEELIEALKLSHPPSHRVGDSS